MARQSTEQTTFSEDGNNLCIDASIEFKLLFQLMHFILSSLSLKHLCFTPMKDSQAVLSSILFIVYHQ